MNTWFRKVGMGAVALTLAGVLGGCNNGNGGGLIRLFFGINGKGSCNSVVVDVNLSEANAVIARDGEGAVQCAINAVLADAGCNISFQELQGGDLRATISGCTIPAVTNLFSCFFEDVDLSLLKETAAATCACKTQGCDGTPPVCISEVPDPTSCEICNNGIDDDGNGLTDCEDPNCEDSPLCKVTTTTSTSTSTSVTVSTSTTNTTTTTSSTSTTVTLVPPLTCNVIFSVPETVKFGSLQWDTDYSNVPGFLNGSADQAECSSLIGGSSFTSFNDKDAQKTLTTGVISAAGVQTPLDVTECTFKAFVTPKKADFAITVTEANDKDLNPIDPAPTVIVKSIDCTGVTTTTNPEVTTTTSTTLPDVTTTTTGPAAANYKITFHLNSASSAKVGSLQWTADYTTATGEFSGTADSVDCTGNPAVGFYAPNDVDATRTLSNGVISANGFTVGGGLDLASCTFNGFSNDVPVPGDFVIAIQDATDQNLNSITAVISVTVTPL